MLHKKSPVAHRGRVHECTTHRRNDHGQNCGADRGRREKIEDLAEALSGNKIRGACVTRPRFIFGTAAAIGAARGRHSNLQHLFVSASSGHSTHSPHLARCAGKTLCSFAAHRYSITRRAPLADDRRFARAARLLPATLRRDRDG